MVEGELDREKYQVEDDLEVLHLGDFENLGRKKRKTKKPVNGNKDTPAESPDTPSNNCIDYTYDELLKRFYDSMQEKNPEMVPGEKVKITLKTLQVLRVGTKKTCLDNFADICKSLRRKPEHLFDFILTELGTTGSVDAQDKLIIKGRFSQTNMENVMQNYVRDYVRCRQCSSPGTSLEKDNRIFIMQCHLCGSRCTVAAIKSGFRAVTEKRAVTRSKEL